MPRTVLGYHGTSRKAVEAVLGGAPLQISRNQWDWLGDGVYFWEYGPVRAWEWARERHGEQAAVLRATIALEGCLDLADLPGTRDLARVFGPFCAKMKEVGASLPVQKGKQHGLDRAVINFFAEEVDPPVRVVRAPFIEGERLWDGSALWDRSHVQLAVRDGGLLAGVVQVEVPENERF
jgi:hypothetical protein